MRRRDTTRHSHAKLDRNPQDQYERENINAFSLFFEIKLLLVLSSSGILQILIGTVGNRTTEQEERVQTDTETRARAAAGRGRRGAAVGAGGWVAGLSHLLAPVHILRCIRKKRGGNGGRTILFNFPTYMPSSNSRASSLWPTSSKASVESWPPTSRMTSSPPLLPLVSFFLLCIVGRNRVAGWGAYGCSSTNEEQS